MIDIINDCSITIAVGHSANSKIWKNVKVTWHDFLARIAKPVITKETYNQFIAAPKADQGKIKDVGGYVGGTLEKGQRNKSSVLCRRLLTLDVDFSHSNFWWDFTMLYDCAAAIHSTHKSCELKPRHRLIIPLNRDVSGEEYQAIARRIAESLNIDLFDPSTFDINRLMFWPSVSSDSEYYFEYQDGSFLNADDILSTYTDWRDTSEWPMAVDSINIIENAAKKQTDPIAKTGIIGAFCRAYSIQDAIEEFLPDIYTKISENRYTYNNGSTVGGLIVYEDKYAYSHHGTDPVSGRLCNAFDLVRLHKFGSLDKDSSEKISLKAMEEFASKDSRTKKQIGEDRLAEAHSEFTSAENPNDNDNNNDNEWLSDLDVNSKGAYENSANNLNLILSNDTNLKDAFYLNTFDNKRYLIHSMPWRSIEKIELMRDVDYSGLRNYIECVYGIVSSQKVDDALSLEFERHKFHPIRDYIKSRVWDNQKRIDTLLIDYFGAEDNSYTRAAIRKTLTAAVARVFEPGVKFDTALILLGKQGTYKSTFIKKLGKDWFSDTFTTVQGREAFEQIQGAWIIEIGELSGFKKAEVETIKHYISKREDSFRPAYGRTVETYRRQCIFFGTTNSRDFLRDPTGNRRFMPIDVRVPYIKKSVADDLTDYEIDQIWAEAYELYLNGEPLYLSQEDNEIAITEQLNHSETDERRGIIDTFLNALYPDNWDSLDLYGRRSWLNDPIHQQGTVQRTTVCIAEIWCECLGRDKADMSRYNTRDINDIMKSFPEWETATSTRRFQIYGVQKYFKRKDLS